MPLFAPNVNSFKRLRGYWEEGTPFNLNWGFENRTCGFRVPNFNSASQARIENRLCGSDVNPYLAIAATLTAGYLGIKKKIKATQETKKAAYNVNVSLTESIYQSIDIFSRSKEAKEIFGETFVELFCSIKDLEVKIYYSSDKEDIFLGLENNKRIRFCAKNYTFKFTKLNSPPPELFSV